MKYKISESHYIMNFAFLFIRLKYFCYSPTIQAAIIKHGKQGYMSKFLQRNKI